MTDSVYTQFDQSLQNDLVHKEVYILPPDLRRTSERMTKAEYTSVIATRAKQLENGSKPFIVTKLTDYAEIAEEEIRQRRCPFTLVRRHTNDVFIEHWNINDMIPPSE